MVYPVADRPMYIYYTIHIWPIYIWKNRTFHYSLTWKVRPFADDSPNSNHHSDVLPARLQCNLPRYNKILEGKKTRGIWVFYLLNYEWDRFQYELGLRRGWRSKSECGELHILFPKKISAFSSRSFLVEILVNPNFAGVDIVVLSYDIWYMYINAMYLNMVVADPLMIHQPIKSSPASCCASWDILCCCFSCSKEAWRQHPAGWLS